jgi:hypothetical protein
MNQFIVVEPVHMWVFVPDYLKKANSYNNAHVRFNSVSSGWVKQSYLLRLVQVLYPFPMAVDAFDFPQKWDKWGKNIC